MTFQAENPTMGTHPVSRAGHTVSELLEDSGNCRQIINPEQNLHLLSDSLFSEQQKLRQVLDWAHSFLRGDSEVHREFSTSDSLILADEEQKETQKKSPAYQQLSTSKYLHPVFWAVGGNEVLGGRGASMQRVWHLERSSYERDSNNHLCAYKFPFSDDALSFIPGRDEVTWLEYKETPENIKSVKLQDPINKECLSQDHTCITSGVSISNQRHCTYLLDRNTNQTLASEPATGLIKETTSCWCNPCHKESMVIGTGSNLKWSYKTAGGQSEGETSGHQMELSKVNVDGKMETKKEVVRMGESKEKVNENQDSASDCTKTCISNSEKTSDLTFSCHLKIPPSLSVYEQYQLCVAQLQHFRLRQSQHIEQGCFKESPAKERKTSEEVAALPTSSTNPEITNRVNKRVTAAGITEERSSDFMNKNQDRSEFNRSRATLTEQTKAKHCDNLTVKETPAPICAESRPICQRNTVTSNTHLDLDSNKCGELISTDKVFNRPMEHMTAPCDNVPAAEETAAFTPNSGFFPKRIECNPGVKGCQSRVKGQKKKAGGRRSPLRLTGESRVSQSSLTNKDISQRRQPSGVIKHTNRHTTEDNMKPTSAYGDSHKCQPPTETHTHFHVDPGLTPPTSEACRSEQSNTSEYSPADVPVCDRWLCLPDEVWLSILSLLPHSDLYRVLQVCSRLHTLATDHTLWKEVRIENSTLTKQRLLCVSRRCPRSLCLYSCSGLSLTSNVMQMFFTLCGKTLEELKVTSCTGLGLHGDQMLPLIGQLCDHVTSVDVSWSGATDTGVKALSDCCAGLQLKSVVLNGCHVTDDSLMKLVTRHKESLCRLEVFGCQFLTPSCLQTIYEMIPGLKHLNIGKVPKVNAHSLTVMTSQLKCLISLNLTGLQAVTDATVDTLLQSCVELVSLTLSSCPGVTDLTLHSISKYTPCIRCLDVSGCKAVTDAGVQSLALGCRRLQQLDLSATGTGNRGVNLLANYCSRHLHTVKLSFCHITLENILQLCRRCMRLKVLHLYGCAHLPTEREIREVNTTVKVYPLSLFTHKHLHTTGQMHNIK